MGGRDCAPPFLSLFHFHFIKEESRTELRKPAKKEERRHFSSDS